MFIGILDFSLDAYEFAAIINGLPLPNILFFEYINNIWTLKEVGKIARILRRKEKNHVPL